MEQTSGSRHMALAKELASEIASGQHAVGSRFSTDKHLQERFGVGRHTVREALKILTEQGLIGRRRKTGTIVLAQHPVSPFVHSLRDIRSLFDFAQSTTLEIRHEGFVRIAPQTAGEFFESPDHRWLRIAGIRSAKADGTSLAWSEIMIPESFIPDRDEVRKKEKAIYEIILEQYHLKLEYVEQKITASQLPTQLTEILGADQKSAGLRVERRYVAHTGATFEVTQNLYPADRFSIYSVIRQRT